MLVFTLAAGIVVPPPGKLSAKLVEIPLQHIQRKLEQSSRGQATVLAIEHGIAAKP